MIEFKAWRFYGKQSSRRIGDALTIRFTKPILPLTLLIFSLFTTGCVVTQEKPVAAEAEPIELPSDPVHVEDRSFPADTLYSLLVAEIAGDRHRFDIMLGNYVQQAETTQDPGVAARAARLARYLKAHKIALEMTEIWLDKEPNNAEAHFIATAELVHFNDLIEAMEHATFLLERGEAAGFDSIAMRAQQGGDIKTTKQLISQYQELATKFPQEAQLYLGLSLLYQHAGELTLALENSQKAIELDPEGFQAAAQETRVLQQMGKTDQALSKLGNLVDRYDDNLRLRVQYARSLLKTDLSAAQDQFEIIRELSPEDTDVTITLALIKYERGLLDEAKELFKEVEKDPRYVSTANYYLGRIARVKNNITAAEKHFQQVIPGAEYVPAVSQLTEILIEQDKFDDALALVRAKREGTPSQTEHEEGLYLLEGQLYSSHGQMHKAVQILSEATESHKDSTRLLYGRAMLYTQLDDLEAAEKDFTRVLELTPDNAAALNAWGYTLADRSERLEEAHELISRAYHLTPDDPAVIDSMGWVEYRLGNTDKALTILKRAMDALPDHEIAAHLGEVLWVSGQQAEARKVWKTGLQNNPNSEAIQSTMNRLNARL